MSVVSAEVPGSLGIQESQAGTYRCSVTSSDIPGFSDAVEITVVVISEYTVIVLCFDQVNSSTPSLCPLSALLSLLFFFSS